MRPPVVAGVGAVLCAGGGVLVAGFSERTAQGCSAVGLQLDGRAETPFVPRCLDPGLVTVAGLVLVIGGGVLLLVGLWAVLRSWSQRERALGPDVLGPRPPAGEDGAEAAAGTTVAGDPADELAPRAPAALSPPAGWYAVPPGNTPMWWDGRSWGTAPTLPAVPSAAGAAGDPR